MFGSDSLKCQHKNITLSLGKKLPSSLKIDWKTAHAAQFSKSLVLTKGIGIFYIESFEQQFVVIKGLFQSDQLKQHMVTIEINK